MVAFCYFTLIHSSLSFVRQTYVGAQTLKDAQIHLAHSKHLAWHYF